MKKRKSIRLTLLTVVVAVAMLFGMGTVSAFATEGAAKTVTQPAKADAQVVRTVEYGDSLADAGLTNSDYSKITTPNGGNISDDNDEFIQIGVYTVTLSNGYTYTISCTSKENYELRVAHNGAEIPTIIQAGESFDLPKAAIWKESDNQYKDFEDTDEKVFCEIEGATVTLGDKTLTSTDKIQVAGEGAPEGVYKVKLDKARAYTVHYYANIGGGTKYIYKDYTVSAQKNFEDKTAPTLNLVNVPTSISLNTKVTLPKATATDNYDQNVKVVVSVEQFDEKAINNDGYVPVKHYEPDENGYGDKKTEGDTEVFENDYNMSFYPMEAVKYRIIYKAIDDAGNSSTERIYTATASDRTSPVFKSIKEEQIPTVWGLTVAKKGSSDTATDSVSQIIKFPTPKFVDNGGEEDLSVRFELRDTVNNNVVVRFDNILDKSTEKTGATYEYNSSKPSYGLYPTTEALKWEDGVLSLDITKYTDLAKADTDDRGLKGKTVTGRYTARYEARDKAGNSESVTYNIDLRDSFTDTVAPTINEVKFDESYLVFTDTEEDFVIPSLEVSDDNDEKPAVEYKLIAAKAGTDLKTVDGEKKVITVKGGETAKLKLVGTDTKVPTLTVDVDGVTKTLEFGEDDQLFWLVEATDDVKNSDSKSNSAKGITVVNGASETMTGKAIHDDAIKTTTVLEVGDKTEVGSLSVSGIAKEVRDFYGFEISLYTKKDENSALELWQNGEVTVYTYYNAAEELDSKTGVLHIDDISFAAPNVKEVTMFIRVFSISGDSKVVGYTFAVNNTNADDDYYSALSWRNEGSVYASYTVKNRELPAPKDEKADKDAKYIIREITGNGRFSLMGYQFSAYNVGSFTFAEYYKLKGQTTGDSGEITYPNGKYRLFDGGAKDTIVITDSSTPAWNLQGKMPTHAELNEKVTLPKLVASTEYANVDVTLDVMFTAAGETGGTTKTVAKDTSENDSKDIQIDEHGVYSFTPKQDGTYKLTYSATYGDSQPAKQEHIIKVGDITPPDFTVAKEHNKNATENDKFSFFDIDLGEGEEVADMTFTKTLKDPAGNTVYTLSGKGNTYRTMANPSGESGYTFTKTGTYTVVYEVKDKAGNTTPYTQTITVAAANVSSPVSTKIISTILIIVGVLLIAGVILYFVRFRKVKSK